MKQLLSLCCWLGLAAAVHATSYTITTGTNGSGTVSCNPTNASYPSGVTVGVTATPAAGWYFSGWSGSITNAVNPTNVTIYANLVIDATFLPYATNTLTLVTNGSGTIDLSPAGGSYASNTTVTATATPATGWVFTGWSGAATGNNNPLSLGLTANSTLTGTFAQLPAFTSQPQSVTNLAGATVTFSSSATGNAPVNYQWYFSGGNLAGATNNNLSLTNVTLAQAGSYWAIITNLYGSATSSIVALSLTNVPSSTNVVSTPTDAALRTAIAAGGWVSFSFSGTITLTNSITVTNNVILDGTGVNVLISGGGSNRIFYVQPGISLTATNLVLANGYIASGSASPADGGAIYNNAGTVTLVDCLLTNNAAANTYNGVVVSLGGAIFNHGGTVALYGSSLSNNIASSSQTGLSGYLSVAGGGAIYSTNGSLLISGSILSSNRCQATIIDSGSSTNACYGGAIFQASGATIITNSFVANNQAGGSTANYSSGYMAASGYGGAVDAQAGTLVISGSQLLGNQAAGTSVLAGVGGAGQGGAIWNGGTLTLQGSTVASNSATAGGSHNGSSMSQGGGIYNAGSAGFTQSVLFKNTASGGNGVGGVYTVGGGNGYGGGFYNGGTATATNCTFALNTVNGGQPGIGSGNQPGNMGNSAGGGLYNAGTGTFTAMNDTFASNSCLDFETYPGYENVTVLTGAEIANTNGTVSLHNCLVAYGGTNANCYGPLTDIGFNMNSDGTATFNSGSSYNNTDPKIGSFANYGGPTLCMDLLGSSPAIGYGDTNGAPTVDQRGYFRVLALGVDVGAVQYAGTTNPPPVIVTQPASVTVASGGSASFSVGVTGATPLTYQWQQNGTNLSGATGATLSLTNLALSQSGYYYSVTVTNAIDSVQSATVWLTVTGPALTLNPTGSAFTLGFAAVSAKTYDLLVSSNLTTWTTQQVIGPFGTSSNFTLLLTSQTNGARFYRLWQP